MSTPQNKKEESSAKKKERAEAISEYLTILYTNADVLLGVTKWEAIGVLEEALEEMDSHQYMRDCLRYSEGQSTDMKARLDMLRATIDFLKARKEHFHKMKEAEKVKKGEKEFDSFFGELL